jgi:hypothetical protein
MKSLGDATKPAGICYLRKEGENTQLSSPKLKVGFKNHQNCL